MSQLRSFTYFTNTAPVQIVLSNQANIKGGNLVNFDGYAAAAGWLQFFDAASNTVLVSGVTVPSKSINIPGAGNFSSLLSSLGPIRFANGIQVAMSSTEAVYTAVATNFDIWGELEEWEFVRDSALAAGDQTSTVTSLAVWTDAGGPKQLRRLQIKEKAGVASYICIFAIDSPAANNIPDLPMIPLAANATVDLYFQISPFRKDTSIASGSVSGLTNDFNTHVGCTVGISQTAGKYDAAGSATIRAEYQGTGVYP